MKKVEIIIDGKAYPCRQTMGAMLRFKQETGKEVTEIDGNISDLCAYLHCCIVSACKKEGIEFGMSLMEFADSITPEDLAEWNKTIGSAVSQEENTDGEEEKKSWVFSNC